MCIVRTNPSLFPKRFIQHVQQIYQETAHKQQISQIQVCQETAHQHAFSRPFLQVNSA